MRSVEDQTPGDDHANQVALCLLSLAVTTLDLEAVADADTMVGVGVLVLADELDDAITDLITGRDGIDQARVERTLGGVTTGGFDEVADILGIRPGTVKSRLSRARKRARKLYEEADK